jgi:murein L,D-transpeptidase YafK
MLRSVVAALPFLLLAGQVAAAPLPPKAEVDRIVIYKGKRQMLVYSGKRLLKTYNVVVGRGGKGPKRFEGDNKTPEGRYRVDRRHVSKTYYRFLHLSYPNAADRRAFAELKRSGKLPKGARIGGAIGIHGEKKGFGWAPHKWFDWTRGCVAIDNDEILELYRAVKIGATVIIRP